VAEVDGQLRINGVAAPKVHIEFVPAVDKGTQGPMAMADTDAQGRFTLQLMEGSGQSSRTGALVGWHRVVFSDLQLAESATGAGVPIRFPTQYMALSSTPVLQEIKEGKQTIQLNIP